MKIEPIISYACYNLKSDIRMNSSSGGVFSLLAERTFSMNGVVYGVAMAEDCYSAEYIAVKDEEGLTKLRGSKYLQARIGDTYKKVKADLLDGLFVLFTGTGCQVNGLQKFLGKDYDNLVCVDVICHGVPSPALWKKYAQHQEKMQGGKLKYVNFRCKDRNWSDFGMKEIILATSEDFVKKEYIPKDKDTYMTMFLRDYCLRPSCYECAAKHEKLSDITIADFWGIDKVVPELNDDNKGISLVLLRTEKGKRELGSISKALKLREVSYEDAVRYNLAEYQSRTRPQKRNNFYVDMGAMSFDELSKKYVTPPFKVKIKKSIKYIIDFIVILGGGVKK